MPTVREGVLGKFCTSYRVQNLIGPSPALHSQAHAVTQMQLTRTADDVTTMAMWQLALSNFDAAMHHEASHFVIDDC